MKSKKTIAQTWGLDQFLKEYGMSSGRATPVSAQKIGANAKARSAMAPTTSPTRAAAVSPTTQQAQLSKDAPMSAVKAKASQVPVAQNVVTDVDSSGQVKKTSQVGTIVQRLGKNASRPDAVIIQKPSSTTGKNEYQILDPKDDVLTYDAASDGSDLKNTQQRANLINRIRRGMSQPRTVETVIADFHRLPLQEQLLILADCPLSVIEAAHQARYAPLLENVNQVQGQWAYVRNNQVVEYYTGPGVPPASWVSRIARKAPLFENVPDHDPSHILNRILSRPLHADDIRGQMDAYFAIPDPRMMNEFRRARALRGDHADMRPIVIKFAQGMLHPSVLKKVNLKESSTLVESIGLANRKAGTTFKNKVTGEVITFESLVFYPDVGAFKSPGERDASIAERVQEFDLDEQDQQIQWTNDPRSNMLAYAIATFTNALGEKVYFGRYFNAINAIRQQNNFPNSLDGDYVLQTNAAVKEQSGYKPTEILHKLEDLTPDEIVDQIVQKFGADSDEAIAAHAFMEATSFPITVPRGSMDVSAFTNYFCELLHPIALVRNMGVDGNADEAERLFLGDQGFKSCKISFGSNVTEGLSDSVLTNSAGKRVLVSSKAKSGAKASAKNLLSKVNELRDTPEGKRILKQYAEEVDILTTIHDGGFIDGPLDLALHFDLIEPFEKRQIKELRKMAPGSLVVGTGQLSARLEEFYKRRNTREEGKIVPFYHLLSAIAYAVCEHVNTKTKFSEAAVQILNHSALVQVYTTASQKGDSIVIKSFRAVYPNDAAKGVKLSAHKSYFSTGNKGNLTFAIL